MVSTNIHEGLGVLREQIRAFEDTCQASLANLLPRRSDLDGTALDLVKSAHERIHQIYQQINADLKRNHEQIMQRHALLPSNVGRNSDYFDTVLTDPDHCAHTELYEISKRVMDAFNDTLLTHYSDVNIDYGPPCVAPRQKWSPEDRLEQDELTRYRTKYPNLREIRGEGNCFYSAFAVRFLEHLVHTQQVGTLLESLLAKNFGENPFPENVIVNLLRELKDAPLSLESRLISNASILPFVKFLRAVAAGNMIKNREFFEAFVSLEGYSSFEDYIDREVLAMGQNVDHQIIQALCNALDFPITLHDSVRDNNDEGSHLGDLNKPALAALCRKGAHYFVVYSDDTVLDSTLASPALPPSLDSSSRITGELLSESGGDRIQESSDAQRIYSDDTVLDSTLASPTLPPSLDSSSRITGGLLSESGGDRIQESSDAQRIEPRQKHPTSRWMLIWQWFAELIRKVLTCFTHSNV